MAQRITTGLTAALAVAALIVGLLALLGDHTHSPADAPPPAQADRSAYTQWFVAQALARFDADGRQATLDYYNSPQSVDGEWYVFVIEEIDGALYTISHATRPDLVGATRERIDVRGVDYGAAFAATTADGHWVDYVILNPASGQDELKYTWIVRHGGLLFGAGWYE